MAMVTGGAPKGPPQSTAEVRAPSRPDLAVRLGRPRLPQVHACLRGCRGETSTHHDRGELSRATSYDAAAAGCESSFDDGNPDQGASWRQRIRSSIPGAVLSDVVSRYLRCCADSGRGTGASSTHGCPT